MFFTNEKTLEKASMDGGNRRVLADVHTYQLTGVVADVVAGRIYWCDPKMDLIETARYDGTDRHIVAKGMVMVPHAFGLAFFDQYIYWTDWTRLGVMRAERLGGELSEIIWRKDDANVFPMSIAAYHANLQPGRKSLRYSDFITVTPSRFFIAEQSQCTGRQITNPCASNNGGCSQLCILASNEAGFGITARCACQTGYALMPDLKTCQRKSLPYLLRTFDDTHNF